MGKQCWLAATAALLAGCDGPQSALDPNGPGAQMAANLWWGMLIVSASVFAVLIALWILALYRTPRGHDEAQSRRVSRRWIIGGGIVLPAVSITVLLGFGVTLGDRLLPHPSDARPLTVEVTGHQWRWEIRYPGHDVALRDRLVIPAGRAIDFHVGSGDVIHSFWVPGLGGKIDAIPGRTNVLRLRAERPGRHRAQCAEFCGEGHAHMRLLVEVLDGEAFDRWLKTPVP